MALEWGTGSEVIELPDERLALRGAQGNRRAFEAIYRRYHRDLYRFCLAMLGDVHDAQDALQSTMVKVLGALPGERRQIKLKPWLYRIARNEAIEAMRRRRERVELEPERTASSAAQVAERAEDRERLRQLFADLEQLPDRQRGALIMRELSGLSFGEIAQAFDTSPATARQTVYEARLGLRRMEEGREMRCEVVTRALSEADGRSLRRRDLRAHLRHCPSCRAFAAAIDERRAKLAALAPLPLAGSSAVLHGVLAASTGKALATSTLAKSAATVAVVAALGVSVAGRVGLVDLPLADKSAKGGGASSGSRAKRGPVAAARVTVAPAGRGQGRLEESNAKPRSSPAEAGKRGVSRSAPAAKPVAGGKGSTASPAIVGTEAPGRAAPSDDPKSAEMRAGRQNGPSPASAHGQQTAAAHRAPRANQAPAAGPRAVGSAHSRRSPGKAKAQAVHPEPSPRHVKAPPGQAKSPSARPPGQPEATSEPAPEAQGPLEQPSRDEHGPDGGDHGPFKR